MASGNMEEQSPRTGRESVQHFVSRLLFCSCLSGEREDEERTISNDPLHPRVDGGGSGEKNDIRIVEGLGIVNASFSLDDEEDPSISKICSSAGPKTWKHDGLEDLSLLSTQPQVQLTHSIAEGKEQEEEFQLPFEDDTDNTPGSGGFLTTPIINLIPPTPSNVVEDNQFFSSNSGEFMAQTPANKSFAAGDRESLEEKVNRSDADESTAGCLLAGADGESNHEEGQREELGEERKAVQLEEQDEDKSKPRFLWRTYQVTHLPACPKKRGFNTGISLLSFTEHNLDDPNYRDISCPDMLKADHLFPNGAMMEVFTHRKRPLTRSCSFGDTTQSSSFQTLTQTSDQCKERKEVSRQRRKTVASFIPHSMDQNGNFTEKDINRQVSKSLSELNTEEVCRWFTSIGLQKCLPFIREAKLCGADLASVDSNTLEILHVITPEDREQLLSAIYNELHPPSTMTQTLDSLLESLESDNVETFTATLAMMAKSKSSPHVSCLNISRRSLKLRNGSQNHAAPRNPQMIEITINASERIVHLRTPKETTVRKVMDSCVKMLGMTEDQSLFTLKEKQDSPEELCPEQQIGTILASSSENKQLELYLCKADKPLSSAPQQSPEINNSGEEKLNKNVQEKQPAKEERIRELNQQVDSLQNVVLQVQELHHDLVAFCSEVKNMDPGVNVDGFGSAELKQRLEVVNSQLNEKRKNLQTLRDNINNFSAHRNKQLEVRLFEKMKLNCQVFKEEITIVHLNRQAAHLQNALQESCIKEKAQRKTLAAGSLSQLVSPQSPAMLMVMQENQTDGHYGFTCRCREEGGLVVMEVENSHLCVNDRLLEVNGEPVVDSTAEELTDLLMRGPSAQIVVIRQLPPTLTSPPLQQSTVSPVQTPVPKRDAVTMETLPQRKLIAI